MFDSEKDSVKSRHLNVQSHSIYSDTKIKTLKHDKQSLFD